MNAQLHRSELTGRHYRSLAFEQLEALLMLDGAPVGTSDPGLGAVTGTSAGTFNGFDLYTTGAVQLGYYADGLAIDTGVPINSSMSELPQSATLPGSLPASPAAVNQLMAQAYAGTAAAPTDSAAFAGPSTGLLVGSSTAVGPQSQATELARYVGSSGGGQSDQGMSSRKADLDPSYFGFDQLDDSATHTVATSVDTLDNPWSASADYK